MAADFDLALGLFRAAPPPLALKEGLKRLSDHLAGTHPFDGDLGTDWTPFETETSNPDAFEVGWLPVQSIGLIWLCPMAHPACAESILEGLLYQIYCRSLDHPTGTQVRSLDFLHRTSNHPRALALCIDLLTLRHFPRRFLPEIVGVTLAHVFTQQPELSADEAQHQRARAVLELAQGLGVDLLRVRKGFALYRDAARQVFSDQGRWGPAQTHRETFAKIVAKKADAAIGYHAKIGLQDRSLDDWFKTHGKSPEPLLKALEESPLVDPACPFASRLIKAMEFEGPMFGVFDGEEREAAARWIASPKSLAVAEPNAERLELGATWIPPDDAPVRKNARGNRALFHQLVAAENSAEVPAEGENLIHRILQRTQRLQSMSLLPGAFHYSPSRLDAFLEERHAKALKPPKRSFFLNRSPAMIGVGFCFN